MKDKFTLIGLPGVGKSTITKEAVKVINSKGFSCEIKSTDEIIRTRIKSDDPVILHFEATKGIKIPAEVFKPANGERPTKAFIEKYGEEPLFRDLEEMFVIDIIQSAAENVYFDLGGKAPLRPAVTSSLKHKQIPPIFLYADHDKIISRLGANDNWKTRSNFLLAGEAGWQQLAEEQRAERLKKYFNIASIIVDVESKTPEQLAKEVIYAVSELKRAAVDRNNAFTTSNMPLLGSQPPTPLVFRPQIKAIPIAEPKSGGPKYRMIL